MSSSSLDRSIFHKQKHIKYWLRCLKTHLPTAYTPNDSQRVTLAFFILSALDLLGVLHTHTTPTEREEHVGWILRCQHPGGGFRGYTGTMLGDEHEACEWDAANLAATYFALAALAVLGDDMERVKKRQCLQWVRRLQRANGSFGEGMGKDGKIEGAEDVRFAQLAAGVRWFLRRGDKVDVDDINVEGLVGWIESSVTYEGGIAQAPFHEAHAGLTYAGVSALALLGKLPRKHTASAEGKTLSSDFTNDLTRWLVSRQTLMLQEDEGLSMVDDDPPDPKTKIIAPKFHVMGAYPAEAEAVVPSEKPWIEAPLEELRWVGVNGRCNKVADTCYTFWVGGSLAILNNVHLQDFNGIRRFLLEKTQHMIGGFGKMAGDLPDILHSYLGLATLATMREPELKSLDATLCIGVGARVNFEQQMTLSNGRHRTSAPNGA